MNEIVDPLARIGVFESSSPRNPSPLSQLEASKESRKLSDLFNAPPIAAEGQSFFDTILQPNTEDLTSKDEEEQAIDIIKGTAILNK